MGGESGGGKSGGGKSGREVGGREVGGREVRKDGRRWRGKRKRGTGGGRNAGASRQHTIPGPSDWGSAPSSSFILNFKKNYF